jgi:IclR family transcriptional regulator, KDG regulon repressor
MKHGFVIRNVRIVKQKPSNLVQTIERVSQILELIGGTSRGMSIRDLSSRLSLPKGTVHRLLSSLAYFGYIQQDRQTKNYFLGLKLLELGNLILEQFDLRKIAEPILRDLAGRTNETVHMVILDKNEIVYIDKIETEQARGGLKMASRVGSRNLTHSCAVGKVLLSYLPEKDVDSLIDEKGLPGKTDNTITSPSKFKDHLKAVRQQGYAIDDEENEKGIRCVAAPVLDDKGRAVSAISVSGPAFRVTKKLVQEALKKEVISAASEISRLLGFRRGD